MRFSLECGPFVCDSEKMCCNQRPHTHIHTHTYIHTHTHRLKEAEMECESAFPHIWTYSVCNCLHSVRSPLMSPLYSDGSTQALCPIVNRG